MKDLLDAVIIVCASYLFVGSVLWMLLIDEMRFECAAEKTKAQWLASFAIESVAVIVLWPRKLFQLARKAVGRS